ncbi:MAG: hypothetical protein HWN67_14360 [Candidatus Helarchaeota archaeon]|nr:hypothetical protein [Candidatus Helarchaeota archaeon]
MSSVKISIDSELRKKVREWKSGKRYYSDLENWVNSAERLRKAKEIIAKYLKDEGRLDPYESDYFVLKQRTNTTLYEIKLIIDLIVYENCFWD